MLQNTFTWPTSVSTEIWTWNIAMLPGIFSNHIQVKTPLSHIYRRECQFQDRCLLRIEHTFDYTPRRHPVAVWLLHNYEEGEVRVTHHMGAIGFGLPLTNRKSSSYENMHSNICLLAGLRSNEPIRGSRARFDLNIGQFSSAAMHSQDKREYDEDGNKKVARGGEEHQFITAEISSLTVDGVQNRRGPRALLLLHSVLHRLMITP